MKETTTSETGAKVTSFTVFCHCPDTELDQNDVCRRCGTQWG